MFVWRTKRVIKKYSTGGLKSDKTYRMLFLFGFIPLFIWVDG